MNGYLNYLIESNLCLLVFMLFYITLFRKETDFNIKRIILLGGVIISILFPFFHIELTTIGVSFSDVISTVWLPEITIGGTGSHEQRSGVGISWMDAAIYIYVAGIIFFLTRFTFQLIKIARLIKRFVFVSSDGLKISESCSNFPSFSFFHYISIGNAPLLSLEEKSKIIKHESIHAKRFHSFDVLLLNILKIFFWFNPIIGTYKKILIELHEFEADARSVENDAIHDYCNLLAKVALMSADLRLANCFTNSLTLKRIEMIRKIKLKISRWKLLVIFAIVPLLFFVIACQDQVTQEVKDLAQNSSMAIDVPQHVKERFELLQNENPDMKFSVIEMNDEGYEKLKAIQNEYGLPKGIWILTEDPSESPLEGKAESVIIEGSPTENSKRSFAILQFNESNSLTELSRTSDSYQPGSDVFTIVDETSAPIGGMGELYKFIGSNLLYPEEARNKKIEGRVFVEFIIEKDGSISNATVLKGVDPLLDKAALDVVSLFPNWVPGKNKGQVVRQKMVLPLSFKLD